MALLLLLALHIGESVPEGGEGTQLSLPSPCPYQDAPRRPEGFLEEATLSQTSKMHVCPMLGKKSWSGLSGVEGRRELRGCSSPYEEEKKRVRRRKRGALGQGLGAVSPTAEEGSGMSRWRPLVRMESKLSAERTQPPDKQTKGNFQMFPRSIGL